LLDITRTRCVPLLPLFAAPPPRAAARDFRVRHPSLSTL
jgi:hypothetical protein